MARSVVEGPGRKFINNFSLFSTQKHKTKKAKKLTMVKEFPKTLNCPTQLKNCNFEPFLEENICKKNQAKFPITFFFVNNP